MAIDFLELISSPATTDWDSLAIQLNEPEARRLFEQTIETCHDAEGFERLLKHMLALNLGINQSRPVPSTTSCSSSSSYISFDSIVLTQAESSEYTVSPLHRLFAISLAQYYQLRCYKKSGMQDYLSRPFICSAFGLSDSISSTNYPTLIAQIGRLLLLVVMSDFKDKHNKKDKNQFLRSSKPLDVLLRQIISYFLIHTAYIKPVDILVSGDKETPAKIFHDWKDDPVEIQLGKIITILRTSKDYLSHETPFQADVEIFFRLLLDSLIREIANMHARNDVISKTSIEVGLERMPYRLSSFCLFYFIISANPSTLLRGYGDAFKPERTSLSNSGRIIDPGKMAYACFNKDLSDDLLHVLEASWLSLIPNYDKVLHEIYECTYTKQLSKEVSVSASSSGFFDQRVATSRSAMFTTSGSSIFSQSSSSLPDQSEQTKGLHPVRKNGQGASSVTSLHPEEDTPLLREIKLDGSDVTSPPLATLESPEETREDRSCCWSPFGCS